MSFSVSYVITGRDELSKVLAKITGNLEKLDAAAQKLNRTMAALGATKGGFTKGASAIAAMSAAINAMDVGKMRQVNEQFSRMQRSAAPARGAGGAAANLPAILARTTPTPAMSASAARALGTGQRAPSGFVGPSMPGSVMLGRGLQRLGQQAITAAASVGQLGAAARKSTPSLGFIAGELFAGATLAAPAVLPIMQYAGTESMEKTFELKTGSAATAASMMKELKDFASTAPFAFEQISNASQKLSMAGIEGEKLRGVMTDLGNISAVSGANIDEIAWAYSRIHRMGIATNEELELMTDRNVDILGYIQRYLKDVKGVEVSYMAIRKAAEQQSLSAALVEDATAHAAHIHMKAMEERSKTLSGMWELLKSNASVFAADIGKAETDALGLREHLKEINDYLKMHRLKTEKELTTWERIGIQVGAVALGVTALSVVLGVLSSLSVFMFGKFMLLFTSLGWVLRGALFLITALMSPLWATIAVIGAMVVAVWYFWDELKAAWGGLPDWWDGISRELTDKNNWTWDNIVQKAAVAAQKLFLYGSSVAHAFRLDFAGAEEQFSRAWNMSWSGAQQQGTVTVNVNTPAGAETAVEGSGVRVQQNQLGRGYTDDWGTPSLAGGW